MSRDAPPAPLLGALAVCILPPALAAYLWWPVLAGGDVAFVRDLALFAAPMKHYWLERVAAGEIPWWTPHVSGGMPFLADVANQVLYPPNLILLAAPSVHVGLSWFVAAHSLGAAWAFHALARAVGAGRAPALWAACAYALSGYAISIGENVNHLPGVVWAPLGLAAFVRALDGGRLRYAAGAALCAAMLVLAGDSTDALMLAAACTGLALWRAPRDARGAAGALAAMALLAALVPAVQGLPTADLLARAARGEGLDPDMVLQWSFPPVRTLELVVPFVLGSSNPALGFLERDLYPVARTAWADSVYVGAIPVLCALAGVALARRRAVPWLLLGAACLIASWGRHLPLAEELVRAVPLAGAQRYPEKLLLWATIAIGVLAALGADRLAARARGASSADAGSATARAGAAVAVAVGAFALLYLLPARAVLPDAAARESALWALRLPGAPTHLDGLLVHALVVAAALGALVLARGAWRARVGAALLALAIVDLAWMHARHVPTMPASLLGSGASPAVLDVMRADGAPRDARVWFDPAPQAPMSLVRPNPVSARIAAAYPRTPPGYPWIEFALRAAEVLDTNTGVIAGVRYLNGEYSPLQPARHARDEAGLDADPHRFARLASIDYVIAAIAPANPVWDAPGFARVAAHPGLNVRVLRVDDPLPRARLVANAIPAADEADARASLARLGDSGGDVVREAVIEGAPARERCTRAGGEAVLASPRPERLEVRVASPCPDAHVVIAESADPGWRARVDGAPAPVRVANARFLAVPVGAGEHEVVLEYRQRGFLPGLALSVLGLALAAWMAARDVRVGRGDRA